MTISRTRPRLLHTIVAMGVALTGGASGACGGFATSNITPGSDGGGDETDAAYPLIDAGGDHYATIGYIGNDADLDGYSTIRTADAYPTIGIDAGPEDAYPTIGYDAGPDDGYPTIGIDAGEPDGYPIIH